jgi:two-component system response regulator ResD
MEEKVSILVVDDEERIRRLLNMYLVREGYEIDEAIDGAEALEKALVTHYDCILLDHMMPEKNGL